jgi:hypothetical protein
MHQMRPVPTGVAQQLEFRWRYCETDLQQSCGNNTPIIFAPHLNIFANLTLNPYFT